MIEVYAQYLNYVVLTVVYLFLFFVLVSPKVGKLIFLIKESLKDGKISEEEIDRIVKELGIMMKIIVLFAGIFVKELDIDFNDE